MPKTKPAKAKPAPAAPPAPVTPAAPASPAPVVTLPAETGPKIETVTAASLSGGVSMPPPSERAIAAIAADDAANVPAPAPAPGPANPPPASGPETAPAIGELDATNRAYDPAKFHPRKDSIGRWVNRGGGRKPAPASGPAPAPASFVGGAPAPAPGQLARDRYDMAAEAYCRTGYVLLDNIFQGGGEWQPENDAEHEGMRAAVAAFLRSIGAVDLPPGLSLALVVATYSFGRFQKPNTKRRAKELVQIVREKMGAKREEPAHDIAAHSPAPDGTKLAAEIASVSNPQHTAP